MVAWARRLSTTERASKKASRPMRATGFTPHLSKACTLMPRLAAMSLLLSQWGCLSMVCLGFGWPGYLAGATGREKGG
ncbi:hypothetical protein D3C84_1062680 [compost metagenome]